MDLSPAQLASRLASAQGKPDAAAAASARERANSLSTDLESASLSSTATSSADWWSPSAVLVFVDWDDTLFPTSWLQSKPKFRAWKDGKCDASSVLSEADSELLASLDQAARGFLVSAAQLGKVVCVTLSARPWQPRLMEAFLPHTAAAWRELEIEVRYASAERMEVRRSSPDSYGVCGCVRAALFEQEEFGTVQSAAMTLRKQRVMRRVLRQFYGRQGSWKNVLSFGDGRYERDALWDIAFEHENPVSPKLQAPKPFRVKTMKMMEDPSVVELCEELWQLQAWLPLMVRLDKDFDETLEGNEEARMDAQLRLEEGAEAPQGA